MTRYLLSRLAQAGVSVLLVAVLVFFLSRITGDPVALMLPPEASPAEHEAMRRSLGLDQSLLVQLARFVGALAQGDLGTSFRFNRPVLDLILARFPYSLLLAVAALAFALSVGLPVGVLAAHRPNGLLDRLARTIAIAGQSIPTFILGVVLVLVFSITLPILPSGGTGSAAHVVLPALTLGWFSAAAITRLVRSSTLEALDTNFVTVARAKGLGERAILVRHAVPNALTAVLSLTALQFVTLASGAVITEAIFDWPGIGLLMVQGAFARDYAVVQGVVMVAALLTIAINLATDLLYAAIDPRISLLGRT